MDKTFFMLDFQSGQFLLVNKPKGWTSFDVVNKTRGLLKKALDVKKIKVGHAGTLDPLATGLLIIATGKYTKQLESIQGQGKGYEVIFKLGATTASYDMEHPEENIMDASHITEADVIAAIEPFKGEIKQYPPIFSAVKINGKRAYKSAHKGQSVEVRPRLVQVDKFELLEFDDTALIKAEIHCGTGTYIRSIVHDLGQALGVGGYVVELKRTFIGEFQLTDAMEIETFAESLQESL